LLGIQPSAPIPMGFELDRLEIKSAISSQSHSATLSGLPTWFSILHSRFLDSIEL